MVVVLAIADKHSARFAVVADHVLEVLKVEEFDESLPLVVIYFAHGEDGAGDVLTKQPPSL